MVVQKKTVNSIFLAWFVKLGHHLQRVWSTSLRRCLTGHKDRRKLQKMLCTRRTGPSASASSSWLWSSLLVSSNFWGTASEDAWCKGTQGRTICSNITCSLLHKMFNGTTTLFDWSQFERDCHYSKDAFCKDRQRSNIQHSIIANFRFWSPTLFAKMPFVRQMEKQFERGKKGQLISKKFAKSKVFWKQTI